MASFPFSAVSTAYPSLCNIAAVVFLMLSSSSITRILNRSSKLSPCDTLVITSKEDGKKNYEYQVQIKCPILSERSFYSQVYHISETSEHNQHHNSYFRVYRMLQLRCVMAESFLP